MVSENRTIFFPFSTVWEATAVLEIAVNDGSTIKVVANTALKSGSSQQGNARRASVASNCVAAIEWVVPALSLYVLR
jgi:hypothetical protein